VRWERTGSFVAWLFSFSVEAGVEKENEEVVANKIRRARNVS